MTEKASKEEIALHTLHRVIGDCYVVLQDMDKDKKKEIGQHALEFIADYPIYASCSNISYDQAIMVAVALGFTTKELVTGEEMSYEQ